MEVFNRYENKYSVDLDTFYNLQQEILQHMSLDSYNENGNKYNIYNIYYDTKDNHLIQNSLQKPRYKEKIRVRSYKIPNLDEIVYIEIKKKVNGLVNKRRTKMKLRDVYTFLETGKMPKLEDYMNKQVLKEIAYILEQHKIEPKIYLSYERIAYFDKEDKDLRISFDTNILTRRNKLELEAGNFGEALLESNQVLMEVKTRKAMPMWITKLMSKYSIYPTSFSKYGKEYESYLKNKTNTVIYMPNIIRENILIGGEENVSVNF